MEKILVTTDLSTNSKAGVRFALQMAKQLKAEVLVYHAIELLKPTKWNDAKYKQFEKEKIEEHVTKVKQFVTEVSKQSEIKAGAFKVIAEIGTKVSEQIILTAKKNKATYICMSTRGAGKIQKILGTNASTLITTSPIPVIVVPQTYRAKTIEKLFYASDFAAINKEMPLVESLAKTIKANVEVFHYDYLLHVEENRKKLEKIAAKFISNGARFFFKKQDIEFPLSTHLENDIKKHKPSLVVLFTKQNRNWFDRLFLSSESANLAFHAKVPLLTFRKKA